LKRTISCSSLSKTLLNNRRRWYIIAPSQIIDTAKKVHDSLPSELQRFAEALLQLNFGDEYYKELLKKYTEKRSIFLNDLTA
jgi:aminotransferase